MLFGMLFGLPSLRVKGLYLAVATLAAKPARPTPACSRSVPELVGEVVSAWVGRLEGGCCDRRGLARCVELGQAFLEQFTPFGRGLLVQEEEEQGARRASLMGFGASGVLGTAQNAP